MFKLDGDSPLYAAITLLESADLFQEIDDFTDIKAYRCKIRYIAALFPNKTIAELAVIIGDIINNRNLIYDDIRVILDGKSLDDSSKSTNEVCITSIQQVGSVLMSGGTLKEAAYAAKVSVDTVQSIDDMLHIRLSVLNSLMDCAMIACRELWSVRKLATVCNISKSRAHRLMVDAKAVLIELGEVVS